MSCYIFKNKYASELFYKNHSKTLFYRYIRGKKLNLIHCKKNSVSLKINPLNTFPFGPLCFKVLLKIVSCS
ncbi:Uncharacterized protein dnm_063630 [Desulfonema magnum]|uniref:Uncharacterized protein n=1 Tax=Desulfonema magnum TaxID=45655 RepID=A0A975BRW2_9BACT|nr:Uncharacterized protein dnm_063630 [Desulfonema magnum]